MNNEKEDDMEEEDDEEEEEEIEEIKIQYTKNSAGKIKNTKSNLLRAIELYCWDCSGGSHTERRNCVVDTCPLWIWRSKQTRKDNLAHREMSDEMRQAASERFKKMHNNGNKNQEV
jgi:hypothetical protein